jgi:hypothetical protein
MVVVGIPKTIDNDIELLDKTFGFDTAVEEAQRAINAAYIEVSDFMIDIISVDKFFAAYIEVRVDRPVTEHLSAQGRPDPRGGLLCF